MSASWVPSYLQASWLPPVGVLPEYPALTLMGALAQGFHLPSICFADNRLDLSRCYAPRQKLWICIDIVN